MDTVALAAAERHPNMLRIRSLLLAPLGALFVIACGSSEGSEFGGMGPDGKGGVTTPGLVGDPAEGLVGGNVDRTSACATGSAAAQRGLSYLVFQFDRSGSMGRISDPKSNISVCKNVLKSFFTDAKSAGFNASLSLFPNHNGNALLCGVGDYSTPVGLMQPLPSAALSGVVDAIDVQERTPTLAALQGAHAYAQTVSAANGGAKAAIVLVTDGQPNDCPQGVTIKQIADYATSIKAESPTYVIGIGKSLTNLNEIAQAGSGRDAFLVDTSNPTLVQQQFTAAIDQVKALNASCELAIPPPPAGLTLDIQKVNVLLTLAGKEIAPLYDEACKADGWHYDNPANPTKVVLCASTCTRVQADPAAKVELLFGCATAGGIK